MPRKKIAFFKTASGFSLNLGAGYFFLIPLAPTFLELIIRMALCMIFLYGAMLIEALLIEKKYEP